MRESNHQTSLEVKILCLYGCSQQLVPGKRRAAAQMTQGSWGVLNPTYFVHVSNLASVSYAHSINFIGELIKNGSTEIPADPGKCR